MTSVASETEVAFRMLPITQLMESPKNPRKHFDPAKLEQLADSIGKHGVLTPMLARPAAFADGEAEVFELAAGHRRFRAALLAGATHVPVRVLELDDVAFLEVLTIENLQRDDLHPLEEAQGYADLMKPVREGGAGYDAQKIADRVGKSVKYVYDRIKLLELIKPARKLFLEGRFTAGHAILLARLKADDQKRAIEFDEDSDSYRDGGLWTNQRDLFRPDDDEDNEDPWATRKAVSVREFEIWIAGNVRLDPARDNEALVFPEIAAIITPAETSGERVVPITFESQLAPELKDEKNRTYGPKMWKRADGLRDSKKCDHSIVGFIAVGPGQGDAFRVCIAKTKCALHWPDEVKKAAKQAKAKKTGTSQAASTPNEPKKQPWEIEREKRERQQAEWLRIAPAVAAAAAAGFKKLSFKAVADLLLDEVSEPNDDASELVPRGKTAEEFVRWLAFASIYERATNEYSGENGFRGYAKLLGIDVAKIRKEHAPEKPTTKPAKKKGR
jgi:ParB/RepB/Spo0J family partition protein